MKGRVVSGAKSVAAVFVVGWLAGLFWIVRSLYGMRLPFGSVGGFKLFVLWVGFTVWVFWSSAAYRRANASSRVHDDSSDKPQFFVADFWQGPLASLGWGLRWVFRNWPSQVCALGLSGLGFRGFVPWVGVELSVYLFAFFWGWFSWVGLRYGDPVFGRFTRRSRGLEDSVKFASGVKSVGDGGLDRIEYGEVEGDARIPVKAWIEPSKREDAAAQLASKVEGAVRWEISEGSDGMVVETFGSFGGEHERLAAWLKDSPNFKGDVKGVSFGEGWVLLEVPAGRTVKDRGRAADDLLKASEGYFFRGEPDVSGDGDRIRVKLWDRFPNRSAEVLESYVNPVLGGEFSFVPVEVDGWGAAFEVSCGPSSKDRWALAEKVRAAIPGAELSAEPEVLGDGDRVRLKFLPDVVSEGQVNQKVWDDLLVEAGGRKPSDPPIEAFDLERDEQDRLVKVVFRREIDQSYEDLVSIASQLAYVLHATSNQMREIAETDRVRVEFWYNQPAGLVLTDPGDVPMDVEAHKLPRVEDRRIVDAALYCSEDGFLTGFTAWGAPVFIDYENAAYHIGLWGLSGSGKGLMATSMILHCLIRSHRLTIVSPKTGEYKWAADYGAKLVHIKEVERVIDILDKVQAENDRREGLISLHGVRNWGLLRRRAVKERELNGKRRGDLFEVMGLESDMGSRMVIFLDELRSLLAAAKTQGGKELAEALEDRVTRIIVQGRSSEINMIVMTQSPLAKDMSVSNTNSVRDALLCKIWMGRNVGDRGEKAMGLPSGSKHPALNKASSHTTGNFMVTNICDGPESVEIFLGRTPYISTEWASILAYKFTGDEEGGKQARRRLIKLAASGELPEWMQPHVDELPVEPEPTTIVDSEEEVWVELEDGSQVLAGDDDVGCDEE